MLMGYASVSARGPGRLGVDALLDEPDALPASAVVVGNPLKKVNPPPAVSTVNLDPTRSLPGDPKIDGSLVGALKPQSITISADAVVGSPAGMTMGTPVISSSGELVVPLIGVTSNGTVNGKPATPAATAHIGTIDLVPPLVSLKSVSIPPIMGLDKYVFDIPAAIALGKALFWDANVGSDGQACASCHFAAGADNRLKNQLNPGQRGGDNAFNPTATGGGGPNYTLRAADFPFFRLKNPQDRNSAIVFESNDVVSSQGTFSGDFVSFGMLNSGAEKCGNRPVDEFSVHGALTRRVAPRNTPTVINAIFNFRNFWDGRANNVFNGNNPFGTRDSSAKVLESTAKRVGNMGGHGASQCQPGFAGGRAGAERLRDVLRQEDVQGLGAKDDSPARACRRSRCTPTTRCWRRTATCQRRGPDGHL